jgi:hypothetical protein
MAAELLLGLHGSCLRTICERTGVHTEGLAQAARTAKIKGKLGRNLRELDTTAAWIRHVTAPKCEQFLALVEAAWEAECSGAAAAAALAAWHRAQGEVRRARDGQLYARRQFQEHYGVTWVAYWEAAAHWYEAEQAGATQAPGATAILLAAVEASPCPVASAAAPAARRRGSPHPSRLVVAALAQAAPTQAAPTMATPVQAAPEAVPAEAAAAVAEVPVPTPATSPAKRQAALAKAALAQPPAQAASEVVPAEDALTKAAPMKVAPAEAASAKASQEAAPAATVPGEAAIAQAEVPAPDTPPAERLAMPGLAMGAGTAPLATGSIAPGSKEGCVQELFVQLQNVQDAPVRSVAAAVTVAPVPCKPEVARAGVMVTVPAPAPVAIEKNKAVVSAYSLWSIDNRARLSQEWADAKGSKPSFGPMCMALSDGWKSATAEEKATYEQRAAQARAQAAAAGPSSQAPGAPQLAGAPKAAKGQREMRAPKGPKVTTALTPWPLQVPPTGAPSLGPAELSPTASAGVGPVLHRHFDARRAAEVRPASITAAASDRRFGNLDDFSLDRARCLATTARAAPASAAAPAWSLPSSAELAVAVAEQLLDHPPAPVSLKALRAALEQRLGCPAGGLVAKADEIKALAGAFIREQAFLRTLGALGLGAGTAHLGDVD